MEPRKINGIGFSGSVGSGKSYFIDVVNEFTSNPELHKGKFKHLEGAKIVPLREEPRDDVLKRYYEGVETKKTGEKPNKPIYGLLMCSLIILALAFVFVGFYIVAPTIIIYSCVMVELSSYWWRRPKQERKEERGYETEIYFAGLRVGVQHRKPGIEELGSVWFEDRPYIEAYLFWELQRRAGKMDQRFFDKLMKLRQFTLESIWVKPDITIFLKSTAERCYSNVQRRKDNNGITLDYLEKLVEVYDEYEHLNKDDPWFVVVPVNGDLSKEEILELVDGVMGKFLDQ